MKRWLFALLTLGSVALRAALSPPDNPTLMSPYEVRAQSVTFKGWIKRTSPHFIVYTDGSNADASKALREFEMLREAGQGAFRRLAANYAPTILILPTGSSDWRKLESKGGVEWKSAATSEGGLVCPVLVAQYDWERFGLGTMRAVYASVALNEMDLTGPFWFEHGFGLFYETATFEGDNVTLGQANPRMYYLLSHPWVPWDRFFQIVPSSPEFVKERLVQSYEAQAAIFTQFLFSNPDRTWTAKLVTWLDTMRSGAKPTQEQFKNVFGQDWTKWGETMQNYLAGGKYTVLRQTMAKSVTHFNEGRPELPVREIRDLFILTQILVQRTADSKASLDALLVTGLQSPNLREMLVAACLERNELDPALRTIRQLIAEGSTNARVYQMGGAILSEHQSKFGLNCRRTGPENADVRAWDEQGIKLEPLSGDLNNLCAQMEAAAPIVDQQSVILIENCYRRLKGRAPTDEVVAALAMALWRMGETKTAAQLATKLAGDSLVAERWRNMASHLSDRIEAEKMMPAGSDPTGVPVKDEPQG